MREFKQYLVSLIVLTGLVSAFVFLRFADDYPLPIGPQFDPHIRQRYEELLNEEAPRLIVFGDSLVRTNVDPAIMTEQLGRRVSAISEPGGGSALFYLILKNNIVRAESKLDVLVLLFRDTMLTAPGFRVHGRFFDVMDEYAGRDDDFTLRLAIRNQMSPTARAAEAYFPPYWGRWDLRALIVTRFINFPVRALFGCNDECVESAMNDLFGNQNFEPDQLNETINSAENYLYTDKNLNFEKQLNRSFLPEIVRICRENDIRLVLVRAKTLRFSVRNPEPDALVEYMNDLRNYAEKNGVTLIDLAHDDRLDPAYFDDLHHLNPEGKVIFTSTLSEAVRSLSLP